MQWIRSLKPTQTNLRTSSPPMQVANGAWVAAIAAWSSPQIHCEQRCQAKRPLKASEQSYVPNGIRDFTPQGMQQARHLVTLDTAHAQSRSPWLLKAGDAAISQWHSILKYEVLSQTSLRFARLSDFGKYSIHHTAAIAQSLHEATFKT